MNKITGKTAKRRSPGRPKGYGKYAIRVTCRLSPEHNNFLAQMEKQNGIKRSDVIRTALNAFIQQSAS